MRVAREKIRKANAQRAKDIGRKVAEKKEKRQEAEVVKRLVNTDTDKIGEKK